MAALIIALAGAAYALAAALRGRAALSRLSPSGLDEALRGVRLASRPADLATVVESAGLGDGVREILTRLACAPTPRQARTAVDEYLGELDTALSAAAAPLAPHARVSMTSGTLAAIVALLLEASDMARAVPIALTALGLGLGGAAAVSAFGRRASERARAHRSDYDRLVSALARWL